MTVEPALVLAWLVLAHLVADFVLQPDAMAHAKALPGGRGIRGLLGHTLVVAACLLPFGLAFGLPGWVLLAVVALSHALIDRTKSVLTRRAETAALDDARRRHASTGGVADGLGPAWTPAPAALFALDQLVHVIVIVAAWAVLLSTAPLDPVFAARVGDALGSWDPATVHSITLRGVVLAGLLIVNVRAGALFVAVLVGPGPAADSLPAPATPAATGRRTGVPAEPAGVPGGPRAWTLSLGPLVGRAVPDPAAAAPSVGEPAVATPPGPAEAPAQPAHHAPAPPARVGEAIGILERLLIVTFVLVRAEAAIGLVIAAKTLARFRQLDDRDFAEYYLLGTLGSVAVAAISAFVALAALDTLG